MTSVSQDGPLRIGEKFLGKYEIRRLIGKGGFARVYHGIHRFMGSHVAIKVLWREGGVDKEVLRRGQAEAQILNQLRHDNIVQIIDAGIEDGHLYLVMELLEGRSLREVLLEHRRLGVEEVLALSAQVADGVHAAHEIGVIHRDLKPENIYVQVHNHVKVLDFGIAKLSGAAAWTTQKGMAHGTAYYMSPEQMQVLPLGTANDIYSLGIIMYEALIGHQPIRALLDPSANIWAIAHAVIHKELPLLDAVDPRIPHDVAALVKRAIDKDPKARFGSMKELAKTIHEYHSRWLASAKAHGVPIPDRDLSQPGTDTGRMRAAAAEVRPFHSNAETHDTEPFSRPLFLGAVSSGTLNGTGHDSPIDTEKLTGLEAAPPANAGDQPTNTNPLRPSPSSGSLLPHAQTVSAYDQHDSRKEHYAPRPAPARREPESAPTPIQINSSLRPPKQARPAHKRPRRSHDSLNPATPAPVETPGSLGLVSVPGVRSIGTKEVMALSVVVGLGLAAAILYVKRSMFAAAPPNDAAASSPIAPTAAEPPRASAPTATASASAMSTPLAPDAVSATAQVPTNVAPEPAPIAAPSTVTLPHAPAPKPTPRATAKPKPTDDLDARMLQLQQDLAAETKSRAATAKSASKPRAAAPLTRSSPPFE